MVFLDQSKAFDKVWHKGLLYKLKKFGIHGKLFNWFSSYLEDRTQSVAFENQISDRVRLNAGVPQGSVLGPLLFLVYINDIGNNILSNIYLFADDTSIFTEFKNISVGIDTINRELQLIYDWSNKWKMIINPSKTKIIHFTKKPNRPQINSIILGDTVIEQVDVHKHLGIYLRYDLTWSNHVDETCTKALKRLGLLKANKYKLPRKCLEVCYFSFIRSILEYGSPLLTNAPNYLVDKFLKIQNEAARIVTGAKRSTSLELLNQELGWPSLTVRRNNACLCIFNKLLHTHHPEYLYNCLPRNTLNTVRDERKYKFQPIRTSREYYSKFFIPYTVSLWNDLPLTIRQTDNNKSFKRYLKNRTRLVVPGYYGFGNRQLNIWHTQLRLNCSNLNYDLFNINIIGSPICLQCHGNHIEDKSHYLLYCQAYANSRQVLFDKILDILSKQPLNYIIDTNLLLFGKPELSYNDNVQIFEVVQEFIKSTNRFSG